MKAPSRMQFQDTRDARRGRLADPALLEIFMKARSVALREGQSMSMANESGHAAVGEKLNHADAPAASASTLNII